MPEVGRGWRRDSFPVSPIALRHAASVSPVRRARAPAAAHSPTRTCASDAVGNALALLQVKREKEVERERL